MYFIKARIAWLCLAVHLKRAPVCCVDVRVWLADSVCMCVRSREYNIECNVFAQASYVLRCIFMNNSKMYVLFHAFLHHIRFSFFSLLSLLLFAVLFWSSSSTPPIYFQFLLFLLDCIIFGPNTNCSIANSIHCCSLDTVHCTMNIVREFVFVAFWFRVLQSTRS